MHIICRVNRVPLPVELVEHFGHMQCSCDMGIFPEVDNVLAHGYAILSLYY
jgi:hypothetical protein